MSKPKAGLLLSRKSEVVNGGWVELVIWKLPQATPDRPHGYKYRLAYVRDGVCVLRYDNERGKGDHRHCRDMEEDYAFTSLDGLLADFLRDVRNWKDTNA